MKPLNNVTLNIKRLILIDLVQIIHGIKSHINYSGKFM